MSLTDVCATVRGWDEQDSALGGDDARTAQAALDIARLRSFQTIYLTRALDLYEQVREEDEEVRDGRARVLLCVCVCGGAMSGRRRGVF